ncbi:Maleylacetate reductase [Fusarium oxysporum f. sp. narcissi]|uniref:Maleylacetate reductase n=1 Tax=Fusarium oxysporum f. sp. narcissi TaxID=451672 RepID=A0A4Q2V634_FUSOX|nr:Maleylacetate reductase [Fusarium oxysporum f. sp. narcissi]
MEPFVYSPLSHKIIFGRGSIRQLPQCLQQLGFRRALVLSTPHQIDQAKQITDILESHVEASWIFSEATMHTPLNITEKALAFCQQNEPDVLVSIGGGSTTGLGKAISFRKGIYHISIPTTYAGSEVTPILGETVDGIKTTKTQFEILPKTVIYDVDLTLTLPLPMSLTSIINAIAHGVEALYAPNTNPIVSLMAAEGVRSLANGSYELLDDPDSIVARSICQYGAWLCGTCLGSVGMSLHHKLCHTLGGSFNLPHAETHTIVLPHALAYNAPKVPQAMKVLAGVLPDSQGDALRGLNTLLNKLGVPRSLKSIGFKEEDIGKAADIAVSKSYANPREIDRELIREVIRRAGAGEDARADL